MQPSDSLPTRPKATILVVDDEDPLRDMVVSILSREGYRVLSAEDAVAGAEILFSEAEKIDLIIADILLPGLSGPEMAREALADFPDVKIIFITGSHEHLVKETVKLARHQYFLQKPFERETLLATVETALKQE